MAIRSVNSICRPLAVAAIILLAGCSAQLHHRDGMNAMERQEYVAAVGELEKAAQLKPGDLEYRRDWLRARENAADKLFGRAQTAIADGDRKSAERHFKEILSIDRENSRAAAGLERLAILERADKDAAQAEDAWKSGDLNRAAELAGLALRAAPGHSVALAVKRDLDAAQMQETLTEPSLGAMYKKPVNLEFRDASLKIVFDALSRSTGINFIFDRDVRTEQRTTVLLKQTALDDAINIILSTGQLEKKVLNATSVLIYPSTPAKLKEYQDLVVRAFYLSNVEAKQAATMLKTVLKIKDVFVDDKYNLLILREPPETITLAEKLIRLHDLEEPEVMLEVEVLEINRSRLLNAGIQWPSQFTVAPLSSSTSTSTNGTTTQTMKLSELRNLNSERIGITVPSATVNLQKIDGDANLLANPRIRVRDREKARIMIGDKVPVVTTTSTNTFVTENIQYLDVGLKLDVEPDIHLRDEVGLKLSLEVSSLVSSVKTNNGSQAYQIGTRNFSSALRLRDGETQILGGLISDEDRVAANRVPLLGELPVLGRLFGSQNDSRQKTEIVLSITPHLIRNMQRKQPAMESFWSGTEASLKSRPIILHELKDSTQARQQTVPAAKPAAAGGETGASPDVPRLQWSGPPRAKVGEIVQLGLNMSSLEALKAATLQLSYNGSDFELVSADDGGFFGESGKGKFNKMIDPGTGTVAVSWNNTEATSARNEGRLLTLKLRAKREVQESPVIVSALMPIGANRSIPRPALPLRHSMQVSND